MAASANQEERDSIPSYLSYRNFDKLFNSRNVEEHATHVLPYLKSDSRILDVGCGIGSITIDFARRVESEGGRVVGVDISEDSIEKARAKAKELGVRNVEFLVGDAKNLQSVEGLGDWVGGFDVVHAHQVLIHVSDPVAVLKGMRTFAKEGGGVVAVRDNAIVLREPWTQTMEVDFQLYENIWKVRGADCWGGRRSHVWLHEAGFSWEKIKAGTASYQSFGREQIAVASEILKNTGRKGFLSESVQEEGMEFWERQSVEADEWASKEEARLMGLDGWVVGLK